MTVSHQEAEAELLKIDWRIREPTTLPNHWHVKPNGEVCQSSAYWLFCWAKASESPDAGWANAGLRAIAILDHIFDKNYTWFNANVDHDYARKQRYINRANHGPHCF